jgi:hypothetical protein
MEKYLDKVFSQAHGEPITYHDLTPVLRTLGRLPEEATSTLVQWRTRRLSSSRQIAPQYLAR